MRSRYKTMQNHKTTSSVRSRRSLAPDVPVLPVARCAGVHKQAAAVLAPPAAPGADAQTVKLSDDELHTLLVAIAHLRDTKAGEPNAPSPAIASLPSPSDPSSLDAHVERAAQLVPRLMMELMRRDMSALEDGDGGGDGDDEDEDDEEYLNWLHSDTL